MDDFALARELQLLQTWAAHIKDVFERRGRSDIFATNNEMMHTCHGCGGYGSRLDAGLCEGCSDNLRRIVDTKP